MSNTIIYGNVTGDISITSPITTDIDVAKITITSESILSNSIRMITNNINTSNSSNISLESNNINISGGLINSSYVDAANNSGNINIICNNLTNILGNTIANATVNGDLLITGNITFGDGSVQNIGMPTIGNSVVGNFTNPAISVNDKGQITTIANGISPPLLTPGAYTSTNITVNPNGHISLIDTGSSGGSNFTITTNAAVYVIPNNAGSNIFINYTYIHTTNDNIGVVHIPYDTTGIDTITITYAIAYHDKRMHVSLASIGTNAFDGGGEQNPNNKMFGIYWHNEWFNNAIALYGRTSIVLKRITDATSYGAGWFAQLINMTNNPQQSYIRGIDMDTHVNFVGYSKVQYVEFNVNSTNFITNSGATAISYTYIPAYGAVGTPMPGFYGKWLCNWIVTITDNGDLSPTGDIFIAFLAEVDPQFGLINPSNGIIGGVDNFCNRFYLGPIKRSINRCGIYMGTFRHTGLYNIHIGFTSQPATFGNLNIRAQLEWTRIC